jgi:hypothetical protein
VRANDSDVLVFEVGVGQHALHQDIPSVTVDGIVGPVTWRALVSGMLSF